MTHVSKIETTALKEMEGGLNDTRGLESGPEGMEE